MNFVTINEKAAAQALDFVVGPEVRVGIERLYELLASAMETSYDEGFEDGEGLGTPDEETFNAGYDAGYEQGAADANDDDESEGFYDASEEDEDFEQGAVGANDDEDEYEGDVDSGDQCNCETCTVMRAERSEQDDTLPAMQEQRKTAPFAWS